MQANSCRLPYSFIPPKKHKAAKTCRLINNHYFCLSLRRGCAVDFVLALLNPVFRDGILALLGAF
jgi:hypothetical protein